MKGKLGVSASIGVVLPGSARLSKIISISKHAKVRLAWLDHYHKSKNISLTCRRFGISRSLLHKWKNRYGKLGLRGLESRSSRPKNLRGPTISLSSINLVRSLRRENPEYSKYKLATILRRDHDIIISASTVGRIITRYNLFYAPPIKQKGHPDRIKRRRKPVDLSVKSPGELIEADVKHLPMLGSKRYGFVSIDVVGKRATVHVATTISSHQAAIAWKKTCLEWGLPLAAMTDNGSENLGEFAKLLSEQKVDHYFARPHTPKDKPVVERFIGSLERECIQWGGLVSNVEEQQEVINLWLKKYHEYRPHQALNYLTPNEYRDKLKREKVSTMY